MYYVRRTRVCAAVMCKCVYALVYFLFLIPVLFNADCLSSDSEKTIMELVADGNVDIVRRMLAADRSAVSTTDDQVKCCLVSFLGLHESCVIGVQ